LPLRGYGLRNVPSVVRSVAVGRRGELIVAVVVAAAVGSVVAWSARSAEDAGNDRVEPDDPAPQDGSSPTTSEADPTVTTESAHPGPPSQAALDGIDIGLQPVVEVEHPTAIAEHPGTGDVYVTSVAGKVVRAPAGDGEPTTVADLAGRISTEGESGLLDIAFDATGEHLYMSLVEANGDFALWEVPVVHGDLAVDAPRVLLTVPSPSSVHHAGDVDIDAGGLLWLSIGDGGPSQAQSTRAQDLTDLRGKILRIDPRPTANAAYGIPPGNPFAGRPDARPEIWAYGLRNPWRFDLDATTGDLWVGDVGRNEAEEVDHLPGPAAGAGANLGWPYMEGTEPGLPGAPPDLVAPVVSYPHEGRCGVTAGGVYRGTAMPALTGAFLYSDLCDGLVRALGVSDGRVVSERAFAPEAGYPVSFGTGRDGEMYVCSFDFNAVYRIVPA
jgi:glucose/arabinose dehydrogenase